MPQPIASPSTLGKPSPNADDSVTIQKAFAMTFAGEDVSIAAARSADEGLSLARQSRPDIIIADGAMPGRTGYDLCTQVRADAALRGVPVYILASNQQPYDEARGRSAGAAIPANYADTLQAALRQWRILYPTMKEDLGQALVACDKFLHGGVRGA